MMGLSFTDAVKWNSMISLLVFVFLFFIGFLLLKGIFTLIRKFFLKGASFGFLILLTDY